MLARAVGTPSGRRSRCHLLHSIPNRSSGTLNEESKIKRQNVFLFNSREVSLIGESPPGLLVPDQKASSHLPRCNCKCFGEEMSNTRRNKVHYL